LWIIFYPPPPVSSPSSGGGGEGREKSSSFKRGTPSLILPLRFAEGEDFSFLCVFSFFITPSCILPLLWRGRIKVGVSSPSSGGGGLR